MNLTQLAYICALNETFDATVWIAVADTVARRSCWHPDYRINLRYRHVSHIHISVYYIYIYTFIYICMYKNIMCRGYRRACPWIYIYIYINGKVGGGNRVTPKYFSAPFHFRLGDVSARIIERIRWCMCAKHSKILATIMNRFDAFMHKVLW